MNYPDCKVCGGTGIAERTAEPIAALCGRKDKPDFVPVPLPCGDCSRRAMGIEPYGVNVYSESAYSIWRSK